MNVGLKQIFPKKRERDWKRGFSLIELIAVLAIFTIMSVGALGAMQTLFQTVKAGREQAIVSSLASQRLEVARNLPFSDIGTVSGNPNGTLPDSANPYQANIEGKQYEVYYEVTYMDDPADGTIVLGTDPAPADYKQVKMFVKSLATGKISSFLTTMVPKGLEGNNNAGALLLQVIDANGQPVAGANLHIENLSANPQIILDRQTDASGNWVEVGLPAGVNAYHIVATKTGYSTDQTYPITVNNPNPIKPDATILVGVITQISFAIDLVSNLTIRTLGDTCQPISGVGMDVKGSKLIGASPDVLKYDESLTSVAGEIAMNNIEWDTYTPTLSTGQSYTLLGTSPVQQIAVLPGSNNTFTAILATATTPNSLLVIVKDSATGTAIEGASVHLQKGGSQPQDYNGVTGGSVWSQLDWTGGSGQVAWSAVDRYFGDNGNVDINSVPTGLRLKKVTGRYVSPGELESSTFDTGTNATNFSSLNWLPTSQEVGATLKFQLATSNDANGPWNYFGPDGTNATFYTVSGSVISSIHDASRYVRYKAYLDTTDDKKTPILTSFSVNYVSGCYTPGQVAFYDLTSGNNYDLDVSAVGYQTYTEASLNINGQNTLEVLMSP